MPFVPPQFAEVGTLVAGGGTGNESVSGLGFNDLALVLLMWNPGTTTENAFQPDFHFGFGAFDGANEFGAYMWADDGDAVSPPGSGSISAALVLNSHTGYGKASGISLDTAGFTINWSEAPAAGQIVYWMAFNADVFEAAVGTLTLPNGGTVSVSGLAFAPASLLLGYAIGNQLGFGCAARNGEPASSTSFNAEAIAGAQFAFAGVSSGDSYSFLEGLYGAGSIMHVADSTQIGPDPEAYTVSAFAGDGFTLTTQSGGGAGAVTAGYVALLPTLAGSSTTPRARSYVSFRDVPGGSPPQAETHDIRVPPDGFFTGEDLHPTCGVFVSPNYNNGVGDFGMAIGFVDDDLNQRCCWSGDDYLSTPSHSKNYSDPDVAVAFRFPVSTIYTEGEITALVQHGFSIDYPSFLDNSGSPDGTTSRYFFHLWGYAGRRLHLLPLTQAGPG